MFLIFLLLLFKITYIKCSNPKTSHTTAAYLELLAYIQVKLKDANN